MRLKLIVLVGVIACFVSVKGQNTKQSNFLYDFEEATLDKSFWSEENDAISLSKEHALQGVQALKWELKEKAKLVLDYASSTDHPINIPCDRVMYIPIYCSSPSQDKLVITLYNGATKLAEARHDLNYRGWLPFQRYIKTDFGRDVKKNFNRIEITYKPKKAGNSQVVWIDGMCTAANNKGKTEGNVFNQYVLGPQAITDYQADFFLPRENLSTYFMEAYSHQKSIDDMLPISDANKAEVDGVLANFTSINVKPFANKLSEATAFVTARNIVDTPDGGVNAQSAWWVYTPAQATTCATYVASLAYAAIDGKNLDAKTNLLKLTRYMLDYGMAPGGGEVGMQPSNYSVSRDFGKGFLYAMPIYEEYDATHPNAGLKQRVIDLLSWCYNYGYIYGQHRPELLTLDQVHVKSWMYFNLASLFPTTEQRSTELRLISRFLERMTEPQSGTVGVIRPDGVGFHHNAMHNSYMYGFQTWITHVSNLKGTSFRVGLPAFQNVLNFVTTLYKQCATTGQDAFYSNAQCGRGAFNLFSGVTQSGLEQLAYIGGDIQGKAYDTQTASLCKLFYPSTVFTDTPLSLDGFHQMNYGNMGVYRTPNYVVTMRGLSANFWGTEIYANANRFGRYQSYGTTEVLYNNQNGYAANGYPAIDVKGWDWNVVPGTTTVHTTWKELNAGGQEPISKLNRADEYQTNNFAGSLSAGNCGIFALDFKENAKNTWGGPENRYTPTQLEFKKSVFAADGLLICLGSNIKSNSSVGIRMATNLFQNILTPSIGSLYINDENAATNNVDTDIPTAPYNWLVTPAGTGYYIPSNNGTLHVVKGTQQTPNTDISFDTSPATFPMITTQVAKAWITHSTKTGGEKYEFVIAPQKTAAQMKQLSADLANNARYKVLQQNEFAHIVQLLNSKTIAYSIFNAQTDFRPLGTLVNEVDNPCLIIAKPNDNKVEFNICSPDVLYPCTVTVNLDGKWTLEGITANITNVDQSMPNATVISFRLIDGLSSKVTLVAPKTGSGIHSINATQMNVLIDGSQSQATVLLSDNKEIQNLRIYNQSGMPIYTKENLFSVGNSLHFNISSYPSGLYCVQVIDKDGKMYTKKMLLR